MAKKEQTVSKEELVIEALVPDNEQPYQVPENWIWTRLGNIASIIGGGTPPSNVNEYYENGEIPWISPADLSTYTDVYIYQGRKNITQLGLQKSSARLLPKDTVLLSSRAPIGYVVIAGNELCTNQGFKSFKPSICYLPKFLYYYLKYSKGILESYASGTTFLELSGSKAALVEFPLPPLAEQQRIVDRIESLFEKLDKAKELVQSALDTFEIRKAAILNKAFTGELTRKWRELNEVSLQDWDRIKLGDCGKWYGGGTPSKAVNYYWQDGDILWVTPKDMKSKYIEDTIDHITVIAVKESSVSLIEEPAILFVVRSGILRRTLPIAITVQKITVNQDMKALIPNNIDLEYLYWFCISEERNIRDICAKSGTTVESVNTNALYNYPVVLPSISEQKEIVRILNELLEKEQQAIDLCDVVEKIDLIKKAILGRAFRGELGTNDPDEESSIELLKKVLAE